MHRQENETEGTPHNYATDFLSYPTKLAWLVHRKSKLSLSWTKSSIVLSQKNIRFCKVIWLINLRKFNKQKTVAFTAILRLLGLILISISPLKSIVTTSQNLRRYLPYLLFLSFMMTVLHGKNVSLNICLNAEADLG